LIGLITFGKNVHVHELAFEECPKSHIIRGTKEIKAFSQIATLLGLPARAESKDAPANAWKPCPGADKFIMPLSECELIVTTILEDLQVDCWGYGNSERPLRCTGAAITTAVGLLEATFKNVPSRVMVFTGGPCTSGPGTIVSNDLKDSIRSHHDIRKGTAPHYQKALKWYEGLAIRAGDNGHVIDLFAAHLDQLGLAEMKVCLEKSGGCMVLDDSFARGVFQGSFRSIFRRDKNDNLAMGFMGEVQVLTSSEFKISGCIGKVSSLDRKHACVADTEVGVGNTCAWRLGGVDPNTTLALYFQIANKDAQQLKDGRQAYVQICTKYRYSTGQTVLRVTTIAKTFSDPAEEKGLAYARAGFDQECAAVIMTRLAVHKTVAAQSFDVMRWLDRMLIKLVQKFATYSKNDSGSFKLSAEFSYYPQFMFHLRRSQFLQIFNLTPDETAFYRIMVVNEDVASSINMIQPSLIAYSLDGPAQAVMLDAMSCQPNRILVLDTFFNIVVWYGSTINKWRENGVHLKPEYDYFAQLLQAPVVDAQELIKDRFPYPMFIECVQDGSQERFLLAKLNPSVTHASDQPGEQPIFTEDVSFKVFMKHLRRLAVEN
jgi:protein transport protein SEC23